MHVPCGRTMLRVALPEVDVTYSTSLPAEVTRSWNEGETFGPAAAMREKRMPANDLWRGRTVGVAVTYTLEHRIVANRMGAVGQRPVPYVGDLGTRRTDRNARFDRHRLWSVRAAMRTGAEDQHVLARHDGGSGGCVAASWCRTSGKLAGCPDGASMAQSVRG